MKRNLLRTLLVGMGMLTAANGAMAGETTTLYERGTTGYEWSTENLTDFTGNTLSLDDTYGAYYNDGMNASDEAYYTISPTENAIINVDAYWYGMSNTGRAFSAGNGVYFRFGNVFVAQNDQDRKHGYGLNGIDNMSAVTTFTGSSIYRNYVIADLTFLHIEMEINTAANVLNYLRISKEGSSDYLVNVTEQTLESPNYTTIAFGYKKAGSMSNNHYEYLKSVKVTQTTQDVSKAAYTINYTYTNSATETTTVSTTTAEDGVVGNTITAASVVTDSEGQRYLIEADAAPTLTISSTAADNVLTVPVRLPYSATLKLTTTIGESSTTTETTFTETDDKVCEWSYFYPMYKLSDGKYYAVDDLANKTAFGETGTFTDGQTIEKAIAYSTIDESVAYFAEAEDIFTINVQSGNVSLSNGGSAAAVSSTGTSLGTFYAGTYDVTTYMTANGNRYLNLHDNANTDKTQYLISLGGKGVTGKLTGSITLSAETELLATGYTNDNGAYNQSADVDYVLIKKAETVDVTVGTDSYATYCPSKALDFTNASSIKAYKASVSGTTVTLTQVTTVAAGEGVLLYADGGATESIVVASGTVTKADDNAFVGVTEATTLSETDDNGNTNFVLSKVDNTVGFFKANNTSIAAGKAYLPVTLTSSNAKSLTMVFDGETTGINEVKAVNVESGAYYNLSGQRISQPTKGLYIVNGKKVIVK